MHPKAFHLNLIAHYFVFFLRHGQTPIAQAEHPTALQARTENW